MNTISAVIRLWSSAKSIAVHPFHLLYTEILDKYAFVSH